MNDLGITEKSRVGVYMHAVSPWLALASQSTLDFQFTHSHCRNTSKSLTHFTITHSHFGCIISALVNHVASSTSAILKTIVMLS